MFCRTAMAISELNTDAPPELNNGNGIPVTGISLKCMPIFTKTWQKMRVTIPTANNLPRRSLAWVAVSIPFRRMIVYNASTTILPKNPVSSAITEKIKSL